MNPVRKKLICSWFLLAIFSVVAALHHSLVAWLILFPLNWLVRQGIPRPVFPLHQEIFMLCLVVGFCLWLVTRTYYLPPPGVMFAAKILGYLGLAYLLAQVIRAESMTYKTAASVSLVS